jgi:hypothetical protein
MVQKLEKKKADAKKKLKKGKRSAGNDGEGDTVWSAAADELAEVTGEIEDKKLLLAELKQEVRHLSGVYDVCLKQIECYTDKQLPALLSQFADHPTKDYRGMPITSAALNLRPIFPCADGVFVLQGSSQSPLNYTDPLTGIHHNDKPSMWAMSKM